MILTNVEMFLKTSCIFLFLVVIAAGETPTINCLYTLPMPTKADLGDCNGYFAIYNDQYVQQYCPPGAKYSAKLNCCVTGRCAPCSCHIIKSTTASDSTTCNGVGAVSTTTDASVTTLYTSNDLSTGQTSSPTLTTGKAEEDRGSSTVDAFSEATKSEDPATVTDITDGSSNTPSIDTELTTEQTNFPTAADTTIEELSTETTNEGVITTRSISDGASDTSTVAADTPNTTTSPFNTESTSFGTHFPKGTKTITEEGVTTANMDVSSDTPTSGYIANMTTIIKTTSGVANSTTDNTTEATEIAKESTATPVTRKTTTTIPISCTNLPTGIFLPDPEHCSLYYVCVWGRAVLMHCPTPLWFDVSLDVCNYPENVKCNADID